MLSPLFSYSDKISLAPRPDYGHKGKHIVVQTNHYEVYHVNSKSDAQFTNLPNLVICRYNLLFDPLPSITIQQLLWEGIKDKLHRSSFLVFDSISSCLIAPSAEWDKICDTYEISLSGPSYSLTIQKESSIDLSSIRSYLEGQSSSFPSDAFQIVDLILRQRPSQNMLAIGKSFFTRNSCKPLGAGAECWLGMYQNLEITSDRLLLNIDTSATTFMEPLNLIDFISIMLRKNPSDLMKRRLSEQDRARLEARLLNVRFCINHRGEFRKRYRIYGITTEPATSVYFSTDGKSPEVSVSSYFRTQYNRELLYEKMPCIIVSTKEKQIFFPFEVCDILEGQRYGGKLSETQTSNMIEVTCQNPTKRRSEIKKCFKTIYDNDDEVLKAFEVTLNANMMSIPARILPAPTLSFGPQSKEPLFCPIDGSWNLKSKNVAIPCSLQAWSVVVVASPKEYTEETVKNFLHELINISQDLGLQIINKSPSIVYTSQKITDMKKNLTAAWKMAGKLANEQPQMLLCILPSSMSTIYGNIKRLCDSQLGVVSQCLQGRQIFHPKRQYCVNLALKINVKLGGINSYLTSDQLQYLSDAPTAVLGCDIVYPGANESGIAAIVASLDPKASKFAVSTRLQNSRSELILDAEEMFKEVLREFYDHTGMKPERVLIYRDGISNQQFENVLNTEVAAFYRACVSLESSYHPQLTMVVVQKRHHSRFFPVSTADNSKSPNVSPGTIVEQGIVHPYMFDFYLCSHSGLQGTSRPAHYHVIYDEYGFTADELQSLTYNLCFTYARSTRSVSIAPPTYYAHLAALRARFHFDSTTDEHSNVLVARQPLTNTMFFL